MDERRDLLCHTVTLSVSLYGAHANSFKRVDPTWSGLTMVKSSHFSKEPGASEIHRHFRPKLRDACAVQAEPPEAGQSGYAEGSGSSCVSREPLGHHQVICQRRNK